VKASKRTKFNMNRLTAKQDTKLLCALVRSFCRGPFAGGEETNMTNIPFNAVQ
jgi:hypothetical protein